MKSTLKCIECGQKMEETQIKNHILSCPSFAGIALKKVTSIYKGLSIPELKVFYS